MHTFAYAYMYGIEMYSWFVSPDWLTDMYAMTMTINYNNKLGECVLESFTYSMYVCVGILA